MATRYFSSAVLNYCRLHHPGNEQLAFGLQRCGRHHRRLCATTASLSTPESAGESSSLSVAATAAAAASAVESDDTPTSLQRLTSFLEMAGDPWDIPKEVKQIGKALLHRPKGTFTVFHFKEATDILGILKRNKSTDAETVNLSIALLERLVVEMSMSGDRRKLQWILQAKNFNNLFDRWREARKTNTNVVSPTDLVPKLQTMSYQLPEFNYPVSTIIDAVTKQSDPTKAPAIAEDLLQFSRWKASQTNNPKLKPSVYTYSWVIHSWSVSGLHEAQDRIDALLRTMKEEKVALDEGLYSILLRYHGRRGQVDRVEELLATMQEEGIPASYALSQAAIGLAKAGYADRPEEIVWHMVDLMELQQGTTYVVDERESQLIGQCVRHVLTVRRNALLSTPELPWDEAEYVVDAAASLVQRILQRQILSKADEAEVHCALMDIYARAGRYDEAEAIFERYGTDGTIPYTAWLHTLIRAYAKTDHAVRVTHIFRKKLLEDDSFQPNIITFNILLYAFTESPNPQSAFEWALEAFQLLAEPKCKDLGIEPNQRTFNCLLHCLARSRRRDSGSRSDLLLLEMERRYRHGEPNVRPNLKSYTFAVQACFQAQDYDLAIKIINRMDKNGTSPTLSMCNQMIHHWSNFATLAAAIRAEQFLTQLFQKFLTKPELKPDALTFTYVMNAWHKSGDQNSSDQIWNLYERMRAEQISPAISTFVILIDALTKSPTKGKERVMAERADTLLLEMEHIPDPALHPTFRLYNSCTRAWIVVGDMERATQVLDRCVHAYMRLKNYPARPTPKLFERVTLGWIAQGNLVRATSLLDMLQRHADAKRLPEGPWKKTFAALLQAWQNQQAEHPKKNGCVLKLLQTMNAMPG